MRNRCISFLFILSWAVCQSAFGQTLELGAEVEVGVGQDWSLPDGQLVNLQIVDKQFHLLFLDQDRVLIEPTLEKAIVRGEEARNKTHDVNLVLRKSSGVTLTHVRKVFPPYDYWLRILVPSEDTEGDWVSLSRLRFRPKASE